MGFRDFHSFNLAMLAKQGWRLITNPNSLCAQVLCKSLVPLLKAGPKAGSSFTWQSVLAGLTTLKRGYIWRIGGGDKVNIWQDPWIPSSPSRRIISQRGSATVSKVSELIHPSTGGWNEDLLRKTFLLVDVNRILSIPLHNNGFEDFIA
jgi:hypothetical protein